MQLISKFNKIFRFLSCFIDIFNNTFARQRKGITITNIFQKFLKESNCKPNKFYNRSIKSFLQNYNIEMYSTNNELKPVAAEKHISTLKNKVYKYVTSILKNVNIDKLNDIANKYNNSYHETIKMKPVDAKPNTYINSSNAVNDKDPKSKIDDIVRTSKHKTIFAKIYIPDCSEEVFVIKNV